MLDKVYKYLKEHRITFSNDNHCIQINNVDASEYEIRVLCARLSEHFGLDKTNKGLEDLLKSDDFLKYNDDNSINDNNTDNETNTDLSNIINIIDNDLNIPISEWEKYKLWRENEALWKIDKDGIKVSIIDCFENIVGFIENFPKTKDKIKFNKIRNIVEFNGRQVVDSDYHIIINYINKYFMQTFSKIKMIKDAVDNVGFKHEYNRWVDYYNNLKYEDDGIDYIDYTIKEVLCCEEQEKYYDLYYETLKIMLLANMSRIYNKELLGQPTKYDTVVALCGKNGGSGKTTFFERLYDIDDNGNTYCYVCAGDSFNPKEKDFIERTHQSVCLFLDEVSMKRSIVTSVKGYITQRDDKFRKAYGFNSESHMRGFIIVASSNNDDILKDYTTNNERRWAIIKISENELNYENVNKAFDSGYRDKLWAFIKNIYDKNDFKLYMTDKRLIKLEEEIQRGYKASNNEDYNSIVHDFLEREYGFVTRDDVEYLNPDFIIQQYKFGDSKAWCINHNKEMHEKERLFNQDKYIWKPEDEYITSFGKINLIKKTDLYYILSKIDLEYTKPTLRSELEFSGIWNGCLKDKDTKFINGRTIRAYWRKNEEEHVNINHSGKDQLPF